MCRAIPFSARAMVLLVMTSVAAAEPGKQAAVEGQQLSLEYGGVRAGYFLHVPKGMDHARQPALVMVLHGSGGTGRGMAQYSRMNEVADREGFIVAYPDGLSPDHLWNGLFDVPGGKPEPGPVARGIDDVGGLRAVIDALHEKYGTDPRRVYVCGFSAGAYMAYKMAVESPDKVAAVGIVAGSLGIRSIDGKPVTDTIPPPAEPVSVIHVYGGKDKAVVAAGKQAPRNKFMSAADCAAFIAKADGAKPAPLKGAPSGAVERARYAAGKGGTEVVLYEVPAATHQWPPPAMFATNEVLWEFFASHPKAVRKN